MSFMNFNLSHCALSVATCLSIGLCGCKTACVTRGELQEILMRHSGETICNLWYIGTKESRDFVILSTAFHTKTMTLTSGELRIADRFPLTHDMDKWLLLVGGKNDLGQPDTLDIPILDRFNSVFDPQKGTDWPP